MKKRITILQPSYMPWLGYFDQINKSDIFIFYDDVLYTKNDWRNRNRIKTPAGPTWLTIPVNIKNRLRNQLLIKDVSISDPQILSKHLEKLQLNYKKSQFFKHFYDMISPIFNTEYYQLADLNIDIIKIISKYLGIKKVTFLRSSELNIKNNIDPTKRLIDICKELQATHYLSGTSANKYLKEELFYKNKIKLEYQEYKHPTYKQLWGEFIPYLSIIDLICNEGPHSLRILKNND
jgi:hypothetical protein